MSVELTFLISAVTALTGTVLGILSARRNGRQDREKHSRETAMIISEIGYVKSGIDDIKRRQEKMDERHYALQSRVTALEAIRQNNRVN